MISILSTPWFLVVWAALMVPSQMVLIRDLATKNSHLMSLMKLVWGLTVLYSGSVRAADLLWTKGRKEIAADGLWWRAFLSVAHCYSGCGMGEITGLIIAVGLLQLGNRPTAVLTFSLAHVADFALTVGLRVQEGVGLGRTMRDAVLSDTPSVTVMQVVAIGVDLFLAGEARMGDVRGFWSPLIGSLTCGLLVAYPVNVALIRFGVKRHDGAAPDRARAWPRSMGAEITRPRYWTG